MGLFTQKWKLPHDVLTLKSFYVYTTFFFQMKTIILRHHVSWMCVQQLAEAGDYGL